MSIDALLRAEIDDVPFDLRTYAAGRPGLQRLTAESTVSDMLELREQLTDASDLELLDIYLAYAGWPPAAQAIADRCKRTGDERLAHGWLRVVECLCRRDQDLGVVDPATVRLVRNKLWAGIAFWRGDEGHSGS